jgi:hypothetical protein
LFELFDQVFKQSLTSLNRTNSCPTRETQQGTFRGKEPFSPAWGGSKRNGVIAAIRLIRFSVTIDCAVVGAKKSRANTATIMFAHEIFQNFWRIIHAIPDTANQTTEMW